MEVEISLSNVIGVLVSLALGLLLLATFHRFIYPLLSARHEKAKLTGSHGRDPSQFSRLVYLIGLVLFPIAGFLLGGML